MPLCNACRDRDRSHNLHVRCHAHRGPDRWADEPPRYELAPPPLPVAVPRPPRPLGDPRIRVDLALLAVIVLSLGQILAIQLLWARTIRPDVK